MLSIVKGPYLQMPTRTSMTIMWETSGLSTSKVVYYETNRIHAGHDGKYVTLFESERSMSDEHPRMIHNITLHGLLPATDYHYKIVSKNEAGEVAESDIHPMRTAPARDDPFSFVITSETGGYGDDTINQRVFDQMKRYRPDFGLFVGDIVQDGRRPEDWPRYFFGPGKELFANTPFYVCPGNHEYNADWYYRYFGFPNPKNYYSFDYGSVHLTAIDSTALVPAETYPESDRIVPGNEQYDFLVNDLNDSTADWKIVFFHYPPYVSGDYQVDAMRRLCPVLEAAHVDLVFNSHTIVYERSHPLRGGKVDYSGGVTYIVAGGAGANPHWLHHKRAWHTAQSLGSPHFVQVIVSGNRMELHAIDEEGRHFDTLQLHKKERD